MKNYGRFFNERNEKHKLTAVILLTAGIITFVAVLHTVRVIIRESGGRAGAGKGRADRGKPL